METRSSVRTLGTSAHIMTRPARLDVELKTALFFLTSRGISFGLDAGAFSPHPGLCLPFPFFIVLSCNRSRPPPLQPGPSAQSLWIQSRWRCPHSRQLPSHLDNRIAD